MKVKSAGDVIQFWIGFIRRYALVDLSMLGRVKKRQITRFEVSCLFLYSQKPSLLIILPEVLGFHISNPQCEHILLACCHDAGYLPVLRQYAAQSSSSERITLLSVGLLRSDIEALGFRKTAAFEPLFCSTSSPQALQPTTNGKGRQQVSDSVTSVTSVSLPRAKEIPVSNAGRLRPILRNSSGRRIDKVLSVDVSLVNEMKKRNLCLWHYLRSNCQIECKRDHEYPRPLVPAEYDALWIVARQGVCHRGKTCDDDRCIYGHGFT
jgi:hypothetical protein